jgi:hypothetical protein
MKLGWPTCGPGLRPLSVGPPRAPLPVSRRAMSRKMSRPVRIPTAPRGSTEVVAAAVVVESTPKGCATPTPPGDVIG